jgi:hypothetical protein
MAPQWGDYVFISFVFPLNAYIFLVNDTRTIHPLAVVAISTLFVIGYVREHCGAPF